MAESRLRVEPAMTVCLCVFNQCKRCRFCHCGLDERRGKIGITKAL